MAKVILADSPSWQLFCPSMHTHLGVLYLAASLRVAGHQVKVIDCHEVTGWNKETRRLVIHQDQLEECDVLGLSSTTANLKYGSELAKAWAKAKVRVLGGPHVTHIFHGPHEEFKHSWKWYEGFDYLMTDECEESFVDFCNAVDGKGKPLTKVPGLVWNGPFGIQRNPPLPLPDVTKLPCPAFDLWSPGFMKGGLAGPTEAARRAGGKLTASLYTARGCPYGCTFCADARTQLREEEDWQIEGQVKMLADLGVQAIRIQDDTYTIKKDRACRIADILDRYGMVWRGTTRVNLVDMQVFRHFADRGCTELGFGIEHGSDRMLKAMSKGTTAAKNELGVKLCQDAGIVARCFLMVGFPGETWESIEEMKKWVRKVKPSACTLSLFTPYPGSDVWNYPEKYGVSIEQDAFERMWQLGNDDDPESIVLRIPTMTKEEVFRARQEMRQFLEEEVGSLDRRQMHGNVGTFSVEACV